MTFDNPSTMQTAVFHGGDRITIEMGPVPQPATGEALLRVLRTALCGSDIKLWRTGSEFAVGHEIFGRVEQPDHPLHGQRSVVYIPLHCGACTSCLAGDTQMCSAVSSLIGWNRPGGYCEYVAVPNNCLLPVPDDIENDLAPLLLDTIGTSAHAVREAGKLVPAAGEPEVLVCGAGPVGLGVILALKALGYGRIYVSDPNSRREALAVSFGAVAQPVGRRDKRFKLIVECSGAHAARNLGIELVLPKGVVVLVGENAAPWTINEDRIFRRKDFILMRTFYFPKSDFEANVELLRSHREEYARLVDETFPLAVLPERFSRFAQGHMLKPLLAFEGVN